MKITGLGRAAVGIALTVAMLAGCGQAQTGGPGMMPQGAAPAGHPTHGKSWMLPEAKAEDLLYVAEDSGVAIFSYPGIVPVGRISLPDDYTGHTCSDNDGDVFVPFFNFNTSTKGIYEYAHAGTSPINTLDDAGYSPEGCSVDAVTGNLAVTNSYDMSGYLFGNLAIYQNAQGDPVIYSDPAMRFYSEPAYDNQGNLFITGFGNPPSVLFTLAELPRGVNTFTNLSIDQSYFEYKPGFMQWDGKYLAIGTGKNDQDYAPDLIRQVEVSGSEAQVVGTIGFKTWKTEDQEFWLQKGALISAEGGRNGHIKRLAIWSYPKGGRPIKWVSCHTACWSPTVSVAPAGSHIRR